MIVSNFAKEGAAFQLKASFIPCAIIQLAHSDFQKLENELLNMLQSMPNLFKNSSVIIDIGQLEAFSSINFALLKRILIQHHMTPIGIRGGSIEQQHAAYEAGLPLLPQGKINLTEASQNNKIDLTTTKLIHTPVRSGTQIYAKKCDLVVMSAVSAGAELIADGNIHVYGPLRGRALAGVTGNTEARIFCRTLEAELVSIAGYYLTKEDMPTISSENGIVQVYLEQTSVRISTIS